MHAKMQVFKSQTTCANYFCIHLSTRCTEHKINLIDLILENYNQDLSPECLLMLNRPSAYKAQLSILIALAKTFSMLIFSGLIYTVSVGIRLKDEHFNKRKPSPN